MEICFKPIGFVKHTYSDEEVKSYPRGVSGYIEILPEYVAGISDLEGFSHIILITYLHKVGEEQRRVLKVKHRRLLKMGIDINDLPEVGVFSTDSPHRPNTIGLSIVRVVKVEGCKIFVDGIDVFDGTPVLDIKPYDYGRLITEIKVPRWAEEIHKRLKEKCVPEEQ
ncbi:MAG: tRNA (N6-threonylcarbamoyladenosine(37)-N6)-methyltransferase TrmO [Desulfurococcaceae archaeon]